MATSGQFTTGLGGVVNYREGDEIIYPTKNACLLAILQKMDKYPSTRDKAYHPGVNYTADFNSWVNATGFMFMSLETRTYAKRKDCDAYGQALRTVRWNTSEGPLEFTSTVISGTIKAATLESCWKFFFEIRQAIPRVQIDKTYEYIQDCLWESWEWQMVKFKIACPRMEWPRLKFDAPRVQMETEQGIISQTSDKNSNTIITTDAVDSTAQPGGVVVPLEKFTSTEPMQSFGQITDRWMPLKPFVVNTSKAMGDIIETLYLPEVLYSKQDCAPNLAPFSSFIYGRFGVELRIVVNANKFHCGKLIVSSKYNSYQADETQNGYQSALARNHVIIDLTANNEGVLHVPFRYYKPFVRLVKHDNSSAGVRPSKYASVYIQILSPLQTGTGGASEISGRVFYRFTDATFTGMSYRVKVQMMEVEDLILGTASKALKGLLVGAERAVDQLGKGPNRDKPGVSQATIVVPKPRLNFATGKGCIDVNQLRVNPCTATNSAHVPQAYDEPKDFYQLSRIWGVVKEIEWKSTDAADTELLSYNVDPASRSYISDYEGEPTPMEFAMSNFAFWSGAIELRFDFVSNSFHTGAVQISAEFGRVTTSETLCESSSTYTKTFHLGEQKSCNFTVPYIYDTIMRRTTANLINPYEGIETSEGIKSRAVTIAPLSRTFVKVRVINTLRPVAAAPQTIKILMYMRAGKNFCMHGIKGASYIPSMGLGPMDNFPNKYGTWNNQRVKRDVEMETVEVINGRPIQVPKEDDEAELVKSGKLLPKGVRNEWNEYAPDKLVRTQMDTGDKETLDETEDFNSGLANLQIQTLDCHMSFKDMLRRPTLILHKIKVSPSDKDLSPYFVPLMPPSKSMCRGAKSTTVGEYAFGLNQSTAVAITSMFRCWRGSMRFTFIIWSGKKPIFVTLLPHSGTRITGHMPIVGTSNDKVETKTYRDKPIYGHNFLSEIIVPAINPTMVVEVPYDTENVWTLMNEDDPKRNYSWRDKGDFNSGHLAITTEEDVTMSIFWSAGDDFELSSFLGPPRCVDNAWAYRHADGPRVQMDFLPEEPRTMVRGLFNTLTGKNIARAALGSVPVVGPGLVAATVANEVASGVVPRINNTLDKLDSLAETTRSGIGELQQMLKEAVERIVQVASGTINYGKLVYDFLLDILIAWMEKSWRVVGIGIVRFITNVFGFELTSWVMDKALELGVAIGNFFHSNAAQVQVVPSGESTVTGILVGIVGSIVGVSLDPRRSRTVPGALLERLTTSSGVAYLVGVLRYVQGIFSYVKDLVMESIGYVSPEAVALKMLSENSELLDTFIREAQIVTSEACNTMLSDSTFRLRCWKTVLQAYQYQRLLCQVPANVCNAQLSKLCTEVIKIGGEKFADLSASPVRYEPFVLCIEGDEGIGKSFMSEDLIVAMLTSLGFDCPSTSSIYYRTAGEKFWSGYTGQPVVVYDEFLNTTDPQRCYDMVTEFQKLKSTSIFIPEMAHLNEKKIKGNPLIVVMLTNGAYPELSDYARYPRAVLRRRDVVIKATVTPEYIGKNLRDLTMEELVHYPNLQFQLYKDSKDRDSLCSVVKDYQAMKEYVVNRLSRYHHKEIQMVKRRTDRALARLHDDDVRHIQLNDPFTLFYRINASLRNDSDMSQNSYTPFEELETAVEALVNHVRTSPPPEAPPIVAPISWEEAGTQVYTSPWFIGGCLVSLGCWKYLSRATSTQLSQWESGILNTSAQIGTCSICLEDTPCLYVCKETMDHVSPHLVCASCHTTSRMYGRDTCPMCRCPDILPRIRNEDLRQMSLWVQMVLKGLRDVKWLCDKITAFFSFVDDHIHAIHLTTYLTSVVLMLSGRMEGIALLVASSGMVYGSIIGAAVNGLANVMSVFQVDDWEDNEPTTSSASSVIDKLGPMVNFEHVSLLQIGRKHNGPCLHHLLLPSCGGIELIGDKWRVPDVTTRVTIDVPTYACVDEATCFAKSAEYLMFIGQYMARNKRVLKVNIIQYFNESTVANRERVPVIFRPEWMREIHAPMPSDWWTYLSEVVCKYKYLIIAAIAATGVIGFVIRAYTFSNRLITGIQSEQYDPGSSPRHRRTEIRNLSERRYFQEGELTPTPLEVARKYIANNTFQFTISVSDTRELKMYGVGLFNHYVLVPRHYTTEIKKALYKGLIVWGQPLNKPQLRHKLALQVQDVVESSEADIAIIKLQPSFPLFKDIRKFIATEKDYERGKFPSSGTLLAVPARGCDFMTEVYVDIKGVDRSRIIRDQDEQCFEARDCIVYNFSRPGACGSLLLREHNTRPIIAMHFAGQGELTLGEGYGIILSVESLGGIVQLDIPTQREDTVVSSLSGAELVFGDEVRIDYVGSLEKDRVPFVPHKSKIIPSLIHNKEDLHTIMEPTILHKNDKRYQHESTPLYEGARKHGLLTEDFLVSDVEMAKDILWQGWYSKLKPLICNPVELTDAEAIIGLDLNFYKGMDLQTSAGYPYVLSDKKSKADYIEVARDAQGKIIDVISIAPEVTIEMTRKREMRQRGIVPRTLYVDTLKDEKRKHDKVVSLGGTRVFCNPSVDYVIESRKKFLHFIAAFMENRHALMHGVGCNPTSSEWGALLKKMVKINTEFVTIDYSNFGPGYNALVAKAAYDIMIDWTIEHVPDLNRCELECLVYECIQSSHICNNTVYDQVGGSPSGAVFTTVINSIVNQLYILLAWISLVGPLANQKGCSVGDLFRKYVALYVYGDDAIMTIDPKFMDIFNGVTINDFFKKYNIVATGADKDKGIQRSVPLSEATFLKRGFKPHPYRQDEWLSPLNWESVISATQWVWKSANIKESTYINCEAALLQAHGHGPEVYKKFQNQVNKALMKVKCPTVLRTWKEIDELFYTQGLSLDPLNINPFDLDVNYK